MCAHVLKAELESQLHSKNVILLSSVELCICFPKHWICFLSRGLFLVFKIMSNFLQRPLHCTTSEEPFTLQCVKMVPGTGHIHPEQSFIAAPAKAWPASSMAPTEKAMTACECL